MKKMFKTFFVRFLVVLIAVQGAVAAQLLTLQPVQASDGDSTPQVVINEVMWMGTTANIRDEWIELYSPNGIEVGPGGLTLHVGSSSSNSRDIVIPEGTTIAADDYYMIANQNPGATVLALVADQLVNAGSSRWISNDCKYAAISLEDEDGIVIDSVGCTTDGDYFYPADSTTFRALERNIEITDGLLASSWHEAYGFANMVDNAYGNVYATPGSANTAPVLVDDCSVKTDVVGTEATVDWTDCFESDNQSQIAGYLLLADGGLLKDDWLEISAPETSVVLDAKYLALGEMISFAVRAIDDNGNLSQQTAFNDYVVRNTPVAPILNDVVNQPDIVNVGKVKATLKWEAVDTHSNIRYEITYGPVDSLLTTTVTSTGTDLELYNFEPNLQYQYSVVAVFTDHSGHDNRSVASNVVLDKVPTLDKTKVVLSQSKPGIDDSINGLAGAVNFGSPVTVNVVHGDIKAILDSQTSNVDGSFPHAVVLGDNSYGKVWIQLIDQVSGKASQAYEFTNDIVAPNAPTLKKLVSKCETDTCRVELSWTDNGPDTVKYQVGYTVDGVEARTVDLTSTAVQTDLAAGKSYKYVVYAYDAAGNVSTASNLFEVSLVKGIQTEVNLVDGSPVVTTTALEGSNVTSVSSSIADTLTFTPKAEASDNSGDSNDATDVETKTEAAKQDWVRIFVVVILLLVVAGGFYALSRTFKEGGELDNVVPKKVAKPLTSKTKKTASKNKKKSGKKK